MNRGENRIVIVDRDRDRELILDRGLYGLAVVPVIPDLLDPTADRES